jgi:hypothetical protein
MVHTKIISYVRVRQELIEDFVAALPVEFDWQGCTRRGNQMFLADSGQRVGKILTYLLHTNVNVYMHAHIHT